MSEAGLHHPSTAVTYNGPDRRENDVLRGIFNAACELCTPFFDVSTSWAGRPLTLLAHKALRDAYPDLPDQELGILCSAVESFYLQRNRHS